MIPLTEMSDRDLLEIAWRRCRAPAEAARWPRARLVEWIEAARPVPRPRRARRPRMKRNTGVGRYCRELLAREASPGMGLSYQKIVQMARRKFPDSAVDERHVRWYAAKMRSDEEKIPADRGRSRWKC